MYDYIYKDYSYVNRVSAEEQGAAERRRTTYRSKATIGGAFSSLALYGQPGTTPGVSHFFFTLFSNLSIEIALPAYLTSRLNGNSTQISHSNYYLLNKINEMRTSIFM